MANIKHTALTHELLKQVESELTDKVLSLASKDDIKQIELDAYASCMQETAEISAHYHWTRIFFADLANRRFSAAFTTAVRDM